jgi:ABC-2 type transport system ATP-binding protein
MITVRGLTKSFGSTKAVDHLSFSVAAGELFAFLGPNGAGKTTTIKILTTLTASSSGSVELAGHDIHNDPGAARRSFGIVFQDTSLDWDLTVQENMQMHCALFRVPKEVRPHRIQFLLDRFGLWDRRKVLTRTLSGGLQRRLEIARALLHSPRILILDEPTLGLDAQSRRQLWSYIKMLNETEGVTVFFTTHYMDEAEQIATRVAVIDHGAIVAEGTPRQLMDRTGCASLEQAFLRLTGADTRDPAAGSHDTMREFARVWR